MSAPLWSRALFSRFPLRSSPDFWRLWFIGLVIYLVRWLDMLAMAVIVYQRTGSPFLVSLVTLLRLVPMSLFGAVFGALAERFERRIILSGIMAGLMLCSVALTLLAYGGLLSIWHLMVASFVGGIAIAADNPVRRLMTGEVVERDSVGTAMSIDVGTNNGSRVFGPVLAGLLLATGRFEVVFITGAITYAVAILVSLRVRHRNPPRASESGSFFGHLDDVRAAFRAEPRLLGALVITMIFNFFDYPYISMVPVIGAGSLGLDAAGTGLLASMDGLGSLVGSVLLAVFAKPAHFGRIYVGAVLLGHLAIGIFAVLPHAILAGGMLVFVGIMVAAFSVMQSTLIFLWSPPHMRARILGVLSVSIGIGPVGFVLIGGLANLLGAPSATAILVSAGIVVSIVTRRYWLPAFADAV